MPIHIGHYPFTGTLGNVTSYRYYDKFAMRQRSSLSRWRVKHSDEFKRTRENANGFSGAGKLAGDINHGFNITPFKSTDGRIIRALQGRLFNTQRKGEGLRGYNTIGIARHGHELLGCPLSKDRHLTGRINVKPNWDYNPETGKIRLWMPKEAHISRQTAPEGTTHVVLRLGVMIVSDYHWVQDGDAIQDGMWAPIAPEQHGISLTAQTAPIEMTGRGAKCGGILLEIENPYPIQEGQSYLITWGLAYYNYNAMGNPRIMRYAKQRRKEEQEGAMEILTAHATNKPRRHTEVDPLTLTMQPQKAQLPEWTPDQPDQVTQAYGAVLHTQILRNRTIDD